MLLSVGCTFGVLHHFETGRIPAAAEWSGLAAALALSVVSQLGLGVHGTAVETPAVSAARLRRVAGVLIAVGGAALYVWGSRALYRNWADSFDHTWISWLVATILLGVGLDLAWGRWPQPTGTHRLRTLYLPLLVLLAIAALYRLGNITDFPGEGAQTQIEDVMTGSWGQFYVFGSRGRWEYLSWAWLAGLGIWLGGPTLTAMRIPFATVSALKTIPLFMWLRLVAGPVGALAGTALFVSSTWDVALSRIPNNHNGLIVATAFALLAGPARRGRPSAYVWLGFFSGYVLHEYVAYRPLAAFALMGATVFSLRDRTVRWPMRLARPLLVIGIIVTMTIPLFLSRIHGRIELEYFDGLRRARETSGYYTPEDPWGVTLQKRIERAGTAASLFFFNGDSCPVRNSNLRPLIDPVAAALLILGIGCAIAHPFSSVMGLMLVGLVATVTGALVVTGNFDVGRVGGAVPYTYALVGLGAAALAAAMRAAWNRAGRIIAALLLTAGVLAATYSNTRFLYQFWTSLGVRQAMRNNLPYLSTWLREHVDANEQVVGVVPMFTYLLGPSDAAWLRGRDMPGLVAGDIETALRYWSRNPRPTVLMVAEGPWTRDVQTYLDQLLPGVQMEFDVDRINAGGDVTYAHLPEPPPGLAQALASTHCRGARALFEMLGSTPDDKLLEVTSVIPFVDAATWPGVVRDAIERFEGKVKSIRVTIRSTILVKQSGQYQFEMDSYLGTVQLRIDGEQYVTANAPRELSAGPHTIEINGQFSPSGAENLLRLLWQGPESAGRQELLPFYRVAVPDQACDQAHG